MAKEKNKKPTLKTIRPITLYGIVDINYPKLDANDMYTKDQIKEIILAKNEIIVEVVCEVKQQ